MFSTFLSYLRSQKSTERRMASLRPRLLPSHSAPAVVGIPFRCSLANQMSPISWDLNGEEAYSPGVLMAFRRDAEPLPGVLHFH